MSDRLYKLIEEAKDVFTAPSKEDLFDRYAETRGWTKNSDGSYDSKNDVSYLRRWVEDGRMQIRFKHVSSFYCTELKLRSLEGCPQKVDWNFDCSYNNRLRDLTGGPEEVGHDFDCSVCALVSLKGAPKKVGGDFWCRDNERSFTEEEIRAVCEVKGLVYVR